MNFSDLKKCDAYSTVYFGQYMIPNGTKPMSTFVIMPIEWIVAEIDEKNNRALLISKYAVDWEGYADCPILYTSYKTSWDESYLRKWLNGEFYYDNFSSDEKNMIIPVYNSAKNSNEKRTIDKIFLLSKDEVSKYFHSESDAVLLLPMVDLVDSDDGKHELNHITYPKIDWWTRTSGKTNDEVVCVNTRGRFIDMGSGCDEVGVRPALWVKLH